MIVKTDINKSQVEGDLTLMRFELLRLEKKKLISYYILCFFTLGIYFLVCYYNTETKKKAKFSIQNSIETSTHILVEATNGKKFIENLTFQNVRNTQQYFVNRKMKYFYNQQEKTFQALQLDIEGRKLSEIAKYKPIDINEIDENAYFYFLKQKTRIQLFGDSYIDIKVPNYFEYMRSQLLQPINFIFYFGQAVLILELFISFFCIALGSQILIMSIIYIFVRITKKQLREACLHNIPLKVERSNGIQTISSQKLVPGDILILNKPITLPFDCILLEGQMQVNEANITGETVPVIKSSLPSNSELLFKYENQKSQLLLEGTTIIKMELHTARALVVRTNFSSFKGQIIRALLYPKPFDERFFIQGVKFCALMISLCSIAYFSVLYQYFNIGISGWQKTLRYLDMIQFCAPPAVPIIINAMTFFGLMRLKSKKIMGSDPMKQIQAGRVQTICFDKTGTLTENYVEIMGYSFPSAEDLKICTKEECCNNNEIVENILGICHQASTDDQETIVGDPIDIQMVQFSGWTIGHDQEKKLAFAKKNNKKLYAISVNEFHSEFQSMSVISQDTLNNKYYLFVKGSPEVIISRCHSQEQKELYLQKLHQFAIKGYRVLGLGYKEVSFDNVEDFIKLQRIDQEKDICFSGFLIFKNSLKKDTQQVISQLKEADLRIKIISGDNPVTTIKIAEEANILNNSQNIILLDCQTNAQENLEVYKVNESGQKSQINFLGNEQEILKNQIDYCVSAMKQGNSFCMTGNAQNYFSQRLHPVLEVNTTNVSQQTQTESQKQQLESFYKLLLLHTQIFARTSPEQKANVVKQIKKQGQVVCMVGDGANDCSAIREADVGISFSDADGQFSAPYISRTPSIKCVIEILLEGRNVLQTSREIFKAYIQVGILRFMVFMALSYFYSGLSDFQMTWQGYVFGYTVNFLLYGLSRPVRKLQKMIIDDNFFGIHTLISMIFSLIIFSCSIIVVLSILQNSTDYIPTTTLKGDGNLNIEGQENTLMFISILVNYFYIYITNYRSSPIKEPIYKNILFFSFIIIQALYSNIIIFTDKIHVKTLHLVPIQNREFQLKIFFTLHGFGIFLFLFDLIFTKNIFFKRYQIREQNKHQRILFDLTQQLQAA